MTEEDEGPSDNNKRRNKKKRRVKPNPKLVNMINPIEYNMDKIESILREDDLEVLREKHNIPSEVRIRLL